MIKKKTFISSDYGIRNPNSVATKVVYLSGELQLNWNACGTFQRIHCDLLQQKKLAKKTKKNKT